MPIAWIYYDYNYGWHRFRNVHAFFSYTMIIALLAGLAPIFASEGTFKTESIILSQKLKQIEKEQIESFKAKAKNLILDEWKKSL